MMPLTHRFASASPRRVIAALGLSVALLGSASGCALTGFNEPSGRDYTAAHGVNYDKPGYGIAVSGAVIVSGAEGSGTLVGGLANKTDEPIVLESVRGVGADDGLTSAMAPITIPARGAVSLGTEGVDGVRVIGGFAAGDFARMTLSFDNGDQIIINAPVASDTYHFEGYDNAPAEETSTP